MSHDLAVWKSAKPLTSKAAGRVYAALDEPRPAKAAKLPIQETPAIGRMYRELVATWPELDERSSDTCPWSRPITRSPRHLQLSTVFSWASDASNVIESLAAKHGLDVYDPQTGKVLRASSSRRSVTNSTARLAPTEARARLAALLTPSLAKLGFAADRKGVAPTLFSATRQRGVEQRISFLRANSRSVGLVVSIYDAELSQLLERALKERGPHPLLSIPLYACAFGRFYAVRQGDRGKQILDDAAAARKAERHFVFQYDVRDAPSVARAARDIERMVRTWVMTFFDRLDTLEKIEAWWNEPSWGKPDPSKGRTFNGGLLRGDIRMQAAPVRPAFLGAALAARLGKKDLARRLTVLERQLKDRKATTYPLTRQQAVRLLHELKQMRRRS